jgi:hypothetical protein
MNTPALTPEPQRLQLLAADGYRLAALRYAVPATTMRPSTATKR